MKNTSQYRKLKLWEIRLKNIQLGIGIVLMLWPGALAWIDPGYWL